MALVLAIEPDLRQAAIIKRLMHQQVHAELMLVDSRDAAVAALAFGVPDVVLLTALMSPRDEEELIAQLRGLDGAEHVQTHTIPQLASSPGDADVRTGDAPTGLLGRFRRKKEPELIPGCDPTLFAVEVRAFLERAAELKNEAAATAARPAPASVQHKARAAAPEAPALPLVDPSSAWSSPFEWRKAEPPNAAAETPAIEHRAERRGSLVTAQPLAVLAEEEDRRRTDAELQRLRAEAETRARADADAAAERLRVEAEARAKAEAEKARLRVEAEARAAEAAARTRKIEAEAVKAAAEEKERVRREAAAEAERVRLEAAAEAERVRVRAAEAQARADAEAAERRARLEAEAAAERVRAEAEARAAAEAAAKEGERLRAEAEARAKEEAEAKERERVRLEEEAQKEAQKEEARKKRERLRREADALAAKVAAAGAEQAKRVEAARQAALAAEAAKPVDSFAEFREEADERDVFRLMPLAGWARRDSIAPPPAAASSSELHDLFAWLALPPQVAGVTYPRGCRIRRVRVPQAPAARPRSPHPVILSKRTLDEQRAAR